MACIIELFSNPEMSEVLSRRGPWGEVVFYSRPAPMPARINEDSGLLAVLHGKLTLIAVADGMGGAKGGSQASRMVVESVAEELKSVKAPELRREEGVRRRVIDAIERANRKILKRGIGSGSTLTVAEIFEGRMRMYQVGDSVGCLVGGRGKLKERTVMHSPVGFAVESGILDAEDALDHQERHYLSNFVGSNECWIEVGLTKEMSARDTVVLGTDGVFDNIALDTVAQQVRSGKLEKVGNDLAVHLRELMLQTEQPVKIDDLSFFLYRQ